MLTLIIRYTKAFRQGHNLTLKIMVYVLYVLSFPHRTIAHIFAIKKQDMSDFLILSAIHSSFNHTHLSSLSFPTTNILSITEVFQKRLYFY